MEDKSCWYIALLVGSIGVAVTSVYYTSTVVNDASTGFLVHAIAGTANYLLSLISLSFSAAEHWRAKERFRLYRGKLRPFQLFPLHNVILVTRVSGLIAGGYILLLPIISPPSNIAANAFLRASTFFYACKVLDLTLMRASQPPILRRGQDKVLYGLTDWKAHVAYVWKAFTETRYKSFTIAVDESRRQSTSTPAGWTYGPLLLLPVTYLFPIAELQIMSGLLLLNLLLETQHLLLHPRCPNWLFWQPFAAVTITEFWGLRWHKGANSFLYSLGYQPGKTIFGKYFGENVGKAAGVLSAFGLSGFWHAWSGVPMLKDEHVWTGSVGLWALFMLQGIGVLIESWLFRNEQWKRGRRQDVVRMLGWTFSVETASIWLRYSLPRAKPL